MTTAVLQGQTCCFRPTATLQRCQAPATAHLVGGCIHEHIRSGYFCAAHTAQALSGGTLCSACYQSPQPHRCPVRSRQVQP